MFYQPVKLLAIPFPRTYNRPMLKNARGFTIVELLIVIVVIALLATIVIVAYNGVQAKAGFTQMQADLSNIRKALLLYHADHDSYPSTIGLCELNWCGWNQAAGDGFVPGLSPTYMQTIPQLPSSLPKEDTYLYQSNGTDFQLIRFRRDGLPAVETQNNPLLMQGQGYDGLGWGYRTNTAWW